MFKSMVNRLCIVIFLFTLALPALYAQQDQTGSDTRTEGNLRIQQDPFVPVATKLAQSLKSKVQLDDDQTNKVRDIIINYYSKVRDIQGIQRAAARDMSGSGDIKGKKRTDRTGSTAPTDRTGTTGKTGTGSGNYGGSGSGSSTTGSNKTDTSSYQGSYGTGSDNQTQRAGGRSDNTEVMQSLRDNDVETNTDIEDVLNDNQKSSWLNVKTSWWQEVKQEAYNFNPASDIDNTNHDMNSDKNKNKPKSRGTGTGTGTESGSGTGTERR